MKRSIITRTLLSTALVSCLSLVASAQQTGGSGGGTRTAPTGGNTGQGDAAAANAGNTLQSQNLFTATEDAVGEVGTNEGRFQSNALNVQDPAGVNRQSTTNATNRRTTSQFSQSPFGNNARGGRGAQNLSRLFQQGGATQTRRIRPSLRLGFVPPVRPAAAITRSVTRRFQKMSRSFSRLSDTRPQFSRVAISAQAGGLVTLRGEVPTEATKTLAENVLRMEPGVRAVRNELTVVAAATAR